MAVLTKVAFLSKWNTIFADNSTRDISEQDLRDFRQDIADSFITWEDVIDDDTFATASANTVPTSESVKAYVDANAGGTVLTATVNISSAEILNMYTSPIQLLPAPGAGKFIQLIGFYIHLIAGASGYSSTTPVIRYASATNISGSMTAFLTGTVNRISYSEGFGVTANLSLVENQAVEFGQSAPASNPTSGNGTVRIDLRYRIVDIP